MGEVPVSCVLLDGRGKLLAVGVNQRHRRQQVAAHAEMVALERACHKRKNWRLPDVTAIVTLEPCPMCLGAFLQARIRALYYGCSDPKAGAVESRWALSQTPQAPHRIPIVKNLGDPECASLLTQFFKDRRKKNFSPLDKSQKYPKLPGEREVFSMEVSVKPLHDRVLVKRLAEEEKTAGGIYIPDTAKEKPQRGQIVAVGKGRVTEDGRVIPLDVKVGDRVLFSKYAGTEIKIDGEEYLMMREDDILGILN